MMSRKVLNAEPFRFTNNEWAVLTLAVSFALNQRAHRVNFPTKDCKRWLLRVQRRLWRETVLRVRDARS